MKRLFVVLLFMAACTSQEWQTFRPANGGFSISIPGTPRERSSVEQPPGSLNKVTLHQYAANVGFGNSATEYSIGIAEYSYAGGTLGTPQIDINVAYDGIKNGMLNTLKSQNMKLIAETKSEIAGLPSREFEVGGEKLSGVAKVFSKENRVYFLSVIYPKDHDSTSDKDKFFSSFQLTD